MKWIFRNLHWLTAISAGIVWSVVYFFFGILHGDWGIYIERFPYLFANLISFKQQLSTPVFGLLSAFLDALILGLVFGFIVRLILKRM